MSEKKKVVAIHPHGIIGKEILAEALADPNVEHVQLISHFKDGSLSISWTTGLIGSHLMTGAARLHFDVTHALFLPQESPEQPPKVVH